MLMRSLIVGLALLCPVSAWAQDAAFVQRNSDANATGVLSYDSNVTAGNTLFLCINVSNAVDGTITGVTDNQSNTWTNDVGPVSTGNRNHYLWRASNANAGATTVTAAVSGTPDSIHMIALEYSGIVTSSPLDQSASATGTSTTPSSGATSATTQANELVLGCIMSVTGETFTAGAGFTNRTEFTGNRVHVEEMMVTATGAQTADGSFSGSVGWAAIVATYKDTTAGGGAVAAPKLTLLGVGDPQ